MTAEPTDRPPPMIARSPEDLLAAVPVVLGFHPAESIVMLCSGSREPGHRQFHARVDLPPPHRSGRIAGSIGPLRDAVLVHRVEQVTFVVYTAHRRLARAASRAIETAFADVGVHGVLRVHDGRWSALGDGREGPQHRYDCGHHAFAVRALVEGTVVHADRAALAASIARDRRGSAQVATALAALAPYDDGTPPAVEVAWAERLVDAATPDQRLSPHDVARLVRLLAHVPARDAIWLRLTHERAGDLVPWWTDVVRRAPDVVLPDAAFLLAFTAWLTGQGALTWCAVDRALVVAPQHSASHLLARLLEAAVPPTDWAGLNHPG